MSKKYLFYDRYKNVKKRIFELLLVMIFIFLGAGLGILKLSNLKSTGSMGLETVYEDSVKPLHQLKKLSDIYGIKFVDTANKVFLGNMSWQQGREHFEETIKKIPVLWTEYMETNLIVEEKKMAEELQILFHTDVTLIKFRNMLLNENYKELEKFIKEGLYQNIEPIIIKIDELYQIQIRIVKEIKEDEKEGFILSSNLGTASIAISIILCLIVLFQWRRCRHYLILFSKYIDKKPILVTAEYSC